MKVKIDPRKKYVFAGGIVVALLVLTFGIMNQSGYVLSGPYLVKGGVLIIQNSVPNSSVFIDERRIGKTNNNGAGEFTSIKPGTRSVLVSQTDTWPWIMDYDIEAGGITTLEPLQVLRETDGEVLVQKDDPVRLRAQTQFSEYREPTRIQPLEREGTLVWVSGANISIQKGDTVRTVFSSLTPITNVFWYGDRSDALIIATQNNVFALDLRQSSLQNFQPIYIGGAPNAVADPVRSDRIFIQDAGQYFYITI